MTRTHPSTRSASHGAANVDRARINALCVGAFLAVVALFGGGSRADVMSLPVVRVVAVLMLAFALVQMNAERWRAIRVPALFLLAFGAIVAAQLVPLPPDLWFALPGHARFAEPARLAGVAEAWRPLSLAPDLTWNSLLSILPPLAAVFGLGVVDRSYFRWLLPMMLVAVAVYALFGALQISSGAPYFYRITNENAGVGLFANRNHMATLLALAMPAIAGWIMLPHPDPRFWRLRFWFGLCAIAALFPFLLTTGSRAGLALGALGGVIALLIMRTRMRGRDAALGSFRKWSLALIPVGLAIVALAAMIANSRDLALQRLALGGQELRWNLLPVYQRIAGDFFPFGSGFGSFDPVYRIYEPLSALRLEYLNHAHNDLAELAIEGGLPALVLLGAFFVWFAVRSFRLWWGRATTTEDLVGRAASALILLLLLMSLVDYPLRTPFLAVIMAAACCCILPVSRQEPGHVESREGVGSRQSLA